MGGSFALWARARLQGNNRDAVDNDSPPPQAGGDSDDRRSRYDVDSFECLTEWSEALKGLPDIGFESLNLQVYKVSEKMTPTKTKLFRQEFRNCLQDVQNWMI